MATVSYEVKTATPPSAKGVIGATLYTNKELNVNGVKIPAGALVKVKAANGCGSYLVGWNGILFPSKTENFSTVFAGSSEKAYNETMKPIDLPKVIEVLKGNHAGPGAHPSGSSQDVHGRRGTSAATNAPKGKTREVKMSEFAKVKRKLEETQGFSYQPVAEKFAPSTGFIVSPYPERSLIIKPGMVRDEDYYEFYAKNVDLLKDTNVYFGGWHDTDKESDSYDHIFFDISIPVATDEEANALAVKHNQRAYWDLVNNREVKTRFPKGVTPKFHN